MIKVSETISKVEDIRVVDIKRIEVTHQQLMDERRRIVSPSIKGNIKNTINKIIGGK